MKIYDSLKGFSDAQFFLKEKMSSFKNRALLNFDRDRAFLMKRLRNLHFFDISRRVKIEVFFFTEIDSACRVKPVFRRTVWSVHPDQSCGFFL